MKKRNLVKATGSAAAFLGAVFVGDPNELLTQGPGVLTGLCLLVTAACVGYLALEQR